MPMPRSLIAVLFPSFAFLAGCACEPAAPKAPAADSLYMRMGGLNGMARVSDEIVNRLLSDPEILANQALQMRAKPENVPGIKVQITVFLSELAGGPFRYTGRSMKDAHAGMAVDEKQWQAMTRDVRAALDACKVPAKEAGEYAALIEALKPDIVEEN